MKKKKRIVFLALFAFAGLISAYFFQGRNRDADLLRTSGIIEGTEVNISSKTSGRLSFVSSREGDRVKAGDIVVKLESDDLKAAVQQARAGVTKAQAAIKVSESSIGSARANAASAEADTRTAESDVEKSRVQLDHALKERQRAEELKKSDFISVESLDSAVTAHEAAKADYAASQARLRSASARGDAAAAELASSESRLAAARADLSEAKANLAYAEAKLADTIIRSPISGIVTLKAFEKGEMVSPGSTILTVVNFSDLYARIDVDESMIDNIALNGNAAVSTPAGRTMKGRISEIGRYAEFATQTDVRRGRQDIKTFKVKIRVDNPGGLLKPGMTVQVAIRNGK